MLLFRSLPGNYAKLGRCGEPSPGAIPNRFYIPYLLEDYPSWTNAIWC
jgi:hypothetical protein